jgi:hypothetical protein
VRLCELFADPTAFTSVSSPVYGESGITISYRCVDLLWKPVGHLVRFVLVNHPVRGSIMLMCTEATLDPIDINRDGEPCGPTAPQTPGGDRREKERRQRQGTE